MNSVFLAPGCQLEAKTDAKTMVSPEIISNVTY